MTFLDSKQLMELLNIDRNTLLDYIAYGYVLPLRDFDPNKYNLEHVKIFKECIKKQSSMKEMELIKQIQQITEERDRIMDMITCIAQKASNGISSIAERNKAWLE